LLPLSPFRVLALALLLAKVLMGGLAFFRRWTDCLCGSAAARGVGGALAPAARLPQPLSFVLFFGHSLHFDRGTVLWPALPEHGAETLVALELLANTAAVCAVAGAARAAAALAGWTPAGVTAARARS
jgi:hypothetical protein